MQKEEGEQDGEEETRTSARQRHPSDAWPVSGVRVRVGAARAEVVPACRRHGASLQRVTHPNTDTGSAAAAAEAV
jgi:hypothetical protein